MSQGSTTKRGNSWMLKWELPRTEAEPHKRNYGYKSVKVKTKKEAEAELRKILSTLDDGSYVEPQRLTLGQWLETWLTDYAKVAVSPKTFERYAELLRLHVAPRIGGTLLQKLTASQIQALYTTLRKEGRRPTGKDADASEARGLSERTLLHVHRVLSQALKEAVRKSKLARNPMAGVTPPRPGKAYGGGKRGERIKALEREQVDALLVSLRGRRLFPVVAIAVGTGMRRGEVLALRWSNVDLEARKVAIVEALEETKELGVVFKTPKNDSSARTIGIDAGLAGLLRRHKTAQAEDALKLGMKLPADALLFPVSPLQPARPRKPRTVSQEFKVEARRAGLHGFRLHDLRHTHATQLLSSGVTINVVADRLGHSSPVITLTVYGHLLKNAEDQAVAVSGSLLEAALASA